MPAQNVYRIKPYTKKTNTKEIKKIVKQELRKEVEMKHNWNNLNELSVSTFAQGTFYDPLAIDQGPGVAQRIGNIVNAQSMHLKFILNNNGSGTNYFRIVVFYANDQVNMTNASDIFQITKAEDTGDFVVINGLDTMYYPLNKNLITPLWDKVVKLSPSTATDGSETKMFSKFIKLHGRKIHYENTNTGADRVNPRLHFGFWAAEAPDDTGLGQTVEISGIARTFYTDP